jgi:hypothetical protein
MMYHRQHNSAADVKNDVNAIVPFLIVESDWKKTNTPLTPTISQNTI